MSSAPPATRPHHTGNQTAGKSTDVAVVGAGITGLSTAWHLAREGIGSVSLFDGSGIGAGATALQPGGVRQQWATELNCRMARESYLFYTSLDVLLQPVVLPALDPCGYLFVVESEVELAVLEQRVALQQRVGVPSELLSPERAQQLVPGLDISSILGAAYCAEDGYFDRPQAVVAAFAAAVARLGTIVITEHVVSILHDGAGWRLELTDGTAHRAGHVVIAAAAATAALLRPLGVELPITTEPRHLFYSNPISERLLEPLVVSTERHFAAKQLADGSVLASDLSASGDPASEEANWSRNIRRASRALLPILEYVSFPVRVDGVYDVTPDAQPILGPIEGQNGLWVAAGMNGRGFMMAPAIGRFIASSISSGASGDPLEHLAAARFAKGQLVPERQVV